MSTITSADEALDRARAHIESAREEILSIHIARRTMWGADQFKPGFIRNLVNRLDALSQAAHGEDEEGNARCAKIDAE